MSILFHSLQSESQMGINDEVRMNFKSNQLLAAAVLQLLVLSSAVSAAVGDPQIKTDHPWYPGELSCSTFERLFKTEAELYTRVTGRNTDNDEDKAIASWFWRNTHYFHCSLEPEPDTWGKGKSQPTCDYWAGLFSYGHGICGNNHQQYNGEMEYLLGHCHSRLTSVSGHSSFEVFLSGGAYGSGKWVLLDSDDNTVCFDKDQKALMNIEELAKSNRQELLTNRAAKSNRGWLPDLGPGEGAMEYTKVVAYQPLSGYAGAPPVVNLRAGETLRRFPSSGLGAGSGGALVYWGTGPGGLEGPNRDVTYITQPERCFNSTARPYEGDKSKRARFGNAVFTYKPDLKSGLYKEGAVAEDNNSVTFEHCSPFIIATKPVNKNCAAPGGTLGLVLNGKAACKVCVSIDNMKSFSEPVDFTDGLDLTDLVKGHYQYWLKFMAPTSALAGKDVAITTRCMASAYVMPHLKPGGAQVTFNASGLAVESIGPQAESVKKNVTDGGMDKPSFTVKLKSPHGEKIKSVTWATISPTGCPPRPDLAFKAEYSTDGKEWKILRDDWHVNPPQPYNPPDTWAFSFFFGTKDLTDNSAGEIQVRISNNKGAPYLTGQFSVTYEIEKPGRTKVIYCWDEGAQEKTAEHVYPAAANMDSSWKIATGNDPKLKWVEMTPVQ